MAMGCGIVDRNLQKNGYEAAELFGGILESEKSRFPESFLQNYLTGSFADTVKWWVREDMKMEPEEVADCYLSVVQHGVSL